MLPRSHVVSANTLGLVRASVSPNISKTTVSNEVAYRQLISRGVTQQLHSSTLKRRTPLAHSGVEQWEHRDRQKSRKNARKTLQQLGVSWDQFVHDIERAEKEKHTLPSTHYVAPKKVLDNSPKEGDQSRLTADGIQCIGEFGDRSMAARIMQRDHVYILSALAKARLHLS